MAASTATLRTKATPSASSTAFIGRTAWSMSTSVVSAASRANSVVNNNTATSPLATTMPVTRTDVDPADDSTDVVEAADQEAADEEAADVSMYLKMFSCLYLVFSTPETAVLR